ncbi:hypothetical protein V6N11_061146 [Hibiscus sabdariffa]|uniref:Uncharacterized protein n=1 Tax=Hibiscus sabdariffa TaxID=183260 RepID=A0ABR2A0I5_9ROSI
MTNEESNFRKIVLETEVVEAMLQLDRWDFDAFIRPYMSPGTHYKSVGSRRLLPYYSFRRENRPRSFSVELVRHSDGYLLMGNGVSAMIRQNIFVVVMLNLFVQEETRKEIVSFLRKKNWLPRIHKIELHAYRCTLEALHASGPLSWGTRNYSDK